MDPVRVRKQIGREDWAQHVKSLVAKVSPLAVCAASAL